MPRGWIKQRTLGWMILLLNCGSHPELGRDYYGSSEDYEVALYWKDHYYPIEDES